MAKKLTKKAEKDKIVAANLRLMASQVRHIEMHCELIFPNLEQANIQGSIRDCFNGIAKSLVNIAQTIES